MENTYLQKVLRSLTKSEWRSFADFLASPYFNKNEKFVRLYRELNPYYPDFAIGDTEKQAIYSTVSGSKTFNDASYRNLCSDLLELAQEFLTYEYLVKDNSNKHQTLTRALIDKEMLELAEKVLKKAEDDNSRPGMDVMETLRTNIWMNDIHILLSIYRNRNRINASNDVMKSDETYRIATEWSLVKIFNSLLNYMKGQRNSGAPVEVGRVNAYLSLYEAIQPFKNPVTKMYYLLVKMTVFRDDSTFFEVKKLFVREKKNIPQKSQENILIGMLDYANDKVSVDDNWRTELFELYHMKLKDKLWNANKDLSYVSLFNAFMNAVQMNELAYAEKVVKQNIEFIHPAIRSSINHLCFAWLHFVKGDFERAHEALTKVETENLLIKYEMRSLQSLIYFEKGEWDVLGSYLESFRHFVLYNKSTVDSSVTKQFSNLCKYLMALMKLEPYAAKKEKEKLVKQINAEEHVYLKKWLLDKIGA